MADAVVPLLNVLILGSFMAGGALQLRELSQAANDDKVDSE
jgi:hypothetical protein